MANSNGLDGFPVEEIPGQDLLYLRVHWRHVELGEPSALAFKDHSTPEGDRPGLSTDWCRYATPQQTQAAGRQAAEYYGVVRMKVEAVRAIEGLTVEHDPIKNHPDIPDNRAHTQIFGDKKRGRVLLGLMRAYRWEIKVSAAP